MKRLYSRFFILAALAAAFTACLPKEEVLYSDVGMVTVLNSSKLLTDNGETYNITVNNSGSLLSDTLKRAMTRCDVLSAVEGKTNEYNVRLMEVAAAFCSRPVPVSIADEDAIGHDGVKVAQGWISGGYLNTYCYIAMYNPTKVDHELNLLYDNVRSNSDTLYFEMRHNAHDECPENPETSLYSFIIAGTYASFPLEGILPEGQKPIVHLQWDWYDGDELTLLRTKTTYSGDLTVK
jgi:hypothetical protein